MLQDGIYFDHDERPPPHWALLFLRAQPGTDASAVGNILSGLWDAYQSLRAGMINDLPGIDLPATDLDILVGYGPKAFALPGAARSCPQELLSAVFRSPLAQGGGAILAGSGLCFAPGVARNAATEEIVIQATASTSLGVNRVIVETHKYLSDYRHAAGVVQVELASAFIGFNREDGRSWLDFHDGISNLQSGNEKRSVLEIKPQGSPEDEWTEGGTYLGFMRLELDLDGWRSLTVAEQEGAVGRSKISGCPLVDINNGQPVSVQGCPFAGTGSILDPANVVFREPPQVVSADLLLSHVQRANHHLGPVDRDSSNRIFRQGYEFLEPPQPGLEMQIGLNFVSFQDTPRRLTSILKTNGWLGGVNFSGDPNQSPAALLQLLKVHAAGHFLCPPAVAEPFPGASILNIH